MPVKRIFKGDELALAHAMSNAGESWRSIGRVIGCNEDTIRREIQPHYGVARCTAIVAARRERRASPNA